MGGKHCCYGTCNNDSRYEGKKPEMKGVFFIPFPKPKTNFEKCKLWIKNCGRKNFGVENITKHTYVCSKHFVGGMGPTVEHPHPIPAAVTDLERKIASKPVRPAPRERSTSVPPLKRLKLGDDRDAAAGLQPEADIPVFAFADKGMIS